MKNTKQILKKNLKSAIEWFRINKGITHRYKMKDIYTYNDERPHKELNMMTPTAFEESVKKMVEKDRPKMMIYQGYAEL